MYTLLRERYQLKDLILQIFLMVVAFFATEIFVESLVESQRLVPESFTLEVLVFTVTWLILDLMVCLISRRRSILRSLLRQGMAQVSASTFVISLLIAELFFKFYSFSLELIAMLALWAGLDFLGQKFMGRSQRK